MTREKMTSTGTKNWSLFPRRRFYTWLLALVLLATTTTTTTTTAFEYAVASVGPVRLVDVTTNISDIYTLFRGRNATIYVDDIAWKSSNISDSSAQRSARLAYSTFLNGQLLEEGIHDVSERGTLPPSTISAGTIEMGSAGRHNVTVVLQIEYDSTFYSSTLDPVSTTRWIQTYRAWVSIFPILVLALLAWSTGNVEISLSTCNLITVCITQGNFFRGTKHMVAGCILGALISPQNGVIILMVFFLGGITSLIHVSGGTHGLVDFFGYYLTAARVVQCLAFGLGLCYFWDDTFSILIVGYLMRPLLDNATTSRPVTAMIIDATAGPIASLVAVSTWMTWEIPLLQQELNRLNLDAESAALLTPSKVFRQSLRYSYYPIFFLILLPLLLWTQRHAGPMLVAERTTQVYRDKRGGPEEFRGPGMKELPLAPGTPCRFWNSCIPLGLITLLFVVTGLQSGATAATRDLPPEEEINWLDVIVNANIEDSWLQAISMGAALYVPVLLLQFQQGGNILFLLLNIKKIKEQRKELQEQEESPIYDQEEQGNLNPRKQQLQHSATDPDDIIRPLLPLMDLIKAFFYGFSRIMPFVIQFILAWAVRIGFSDLGLDRWIATGLAENVDSMSEGLIPTAAFGVAFFMSFFTGGATRGKNASILLPLLVKPVFEATFATNPNLMYQVIGAVFSGCVAGDHASPLSDSTLLSALSSDCHLKAHFETQLPYILFVIIVSMAAGTLPVGYGAYPNGVSYGLGMVCLVIFALFICVPVLDPTGEWDIFTKLYLRLFYGPPRGDEELEGSVADNPFDELKRATSRAGEDPPSSVIGDELLPAYSKGESDRSEYEDEELHSPNKDRNPRYSGRYDTQTSSSDSAEIGVEIVSPSRRSKRRNP